MNKDYREILCEVYYHYENVPEVMHDLVAKEFMKNRGVIVDIFNNYIEDINSYCDQMGIPGTVTGDRDGDFNPEYVKVIKDALKTPIEKANKNFPLVKYMIGDDADINGYIPWLIGSRIWIIIKLLDEEPA